MREIDILIVGAGFAGLVIAERVATQLRRRCLVVERRGHIGGNAQDEYDSAGVLIHKYGPHYFRTNSKLVIEYLSQFTEWHPIEYRLRSHTHGRDWSFPINLTTYEQFIGRESTTEEFEAYLAANRVPIENPKNSEEVIISQVGWDFYELFFKNYTLKQWQRHPRELDASVCGRIPVRTNRDDRYLQESFQALPKDGYHKLFERLAAASANIEVRLNTDYREVLPSIRWKHMIYTGPIDEYFDCCFGPLPYRSLRFEPESFSPDQLGERLPVSGKPGFWQSAMQINYPNDHEFTRIVETKHATGQQCDNTTIVREYPEQYGPGKEPYYPIPAPDTKELYRKYADRAELEQNVSFIGRLATYRYYNMDQVVAMALTEFEKLKNRFTRP
jgi:UDP-galactopyranose mutase